MFQEEPFDSLTVRFRAGGMHEMCDRLFRRGLAVTVAEPEGLRLSLAELTGAWRYITACSATNRKVNKPTVR